MPPAAERFAGQQLLAGARRVEMTAVRVPWDDPGPAIDAARDLLGLPARAVDR